MLTSALAVVGLTKDQLKVSVSFSIVLLHSKQNVYSNQNLTFWFPHSTYMAYLLSYCLLAPSLKLVGGFEGCEYIWSELLAL